jgi:hypothetical protein
MGHFHSEGKRYADGEHLDGFAVTDLDIAVGGTVLTNFAPESVIEEGQELKFLFWDTGRRITGKRRVRWTFHHPENWSEWNATAWYGVPPTGGPGTPVVTANAFRVGQGPLDPTPIHAAASTFVNGPGGTPVAYPYLGDDHAALTQFGAAHITAKGSIGTGVAQVNFSSWTRLIFGGDDSGYFEENDDDITSGSGVTGIENSTSDLIDIPRNQSAVLLAGYVKPVNNGYFDLKRFLDFFKESKFGGIKLPDRGDPSPEDIIRLKLIAESLDIVRGGKVTEADAFEGLVDAARKMSATELKRTISGTKATLLRGQAALKSLEALSKKVKR